MKSALRVSLLALVLALAVSIVPAAESPPSGAPGKEEESAARQRAARKDRILLRQVGAKMVVEIYRVTGIGGMKLQPPTGGWPASVVIHLHKFPDLESFTARGTDSGLDCGLSRPEGVPPRIVCRVGGEEMDAIQRKADHFEVTLPAVVLGAGNPVELHWVDQYR